MTQQTNLSTWPERIYMQHGDGPAVPAFHDVYANDAVTWCQDQTEPLDVQYVRGDIAGDLLAALQKLEHSASFAAIEVVSERVAVWDAIDHARAAIAKATGSAA